jgi:DNA-binding response OmpR family regulator
VPPIRVALLDRNERWLRSLEAFLGRQAEEVAVAAARHTVMSARTYLDESGASLILIGMGLPGTKALEWIREVRATRPTAGIIALVLVEHADGEPARLAGADDVVVKDRVEQDLLPALRRVAERRRSDPPPSPAGTADT